jgi:predicted MFS family arabinose efflux permease
MEQRCGGPGLGRDFNLLWSGLSISLVGSELTAVALPLLAALALHASPLGMGAIAACGKAAYLVVGVPAGELADRVRRRPLIVVADLSRAALLAVVVVLALTHVLSVVLVAVVAFVLASLAALFDVAHYAYLPWILGRDRLLRGNGRLQASYSTAESAGPGLGGVIVAAAGASTALVADALSYLVSAACTLTVDREEPARARDESHGIAVGIETLLRHPLLRPIVLTSAVATIGFDCSLAVTILFLLRDLGLGPALVGLAFAARGLGAVPGALVADGAARRLGLGRAIAGGWIVQGAGLLLLSLAFGPPPLVMVVIAVSGLSAGLGETIANVGQWSLRQALVADEIQARVTGAHRTIVYGAGALGATAGGVLGEAIGLRPTLGVGGGVFLAASLAFTRTRVRSVREL